MEKYNTMFTSVYVETKEGYTFNEALRGIKDGILEVREDDIAAIAAIPERIKEYKEQFEDMNDLHISKLNFTVTLEKATWPYNTIINSHNFRLEF